MYQELIKDFFKNDLRHGFYGRICTFFKEMCINNHI